MAKTNYSSMRKAEEVKEAPVEEVVEAPVEEVKEEVKKPAKKEKKAVVPETGKVIGIANLNVRQNPSLSAGIITTLSPGTEITILEQSEEWYKISIPVAGFVMRKFIEV